MDMFLLFNIYHTLKILSNQRLRYVYTNYDSNSNIDYMCYKIPLLHIESF